MRFVPGGVQEVALATFAYLILEFLDGVLLPVDCGLEFVGPPGFLHDK
jgi:hypothetical protein